MASAAAQNLQAIQVALDEHKVRCGRLEQAILMNPLEVDRLGWSDYLGIPIEGDHSVGTGRIEIACEGDEAGAEEAQESRTLRIDIELPVTTPTA